MTKQIIKSLKKTDIAIIPFSDLDKFLSEMNVLEEVDTYMNDYLRIVTVDDHVLVQELSSKKEVIIRRMISLDAARNFITQRMEIYDKMWDGCGCKINYYE